MPRKNDKHKRLKPKSAGSKEAEGTPVDPREGDPFGPPRTAVEVRCLHCGRQYSSALIRYVREKPEEETSHGFYCCPTEGCDGKGFGFDIFPVQQPWTDPDGDPDEPPMVGGFFHDDGTPMSAEDFFRADKAFDMEGWEREQEEKKKKGDRKKDEGREGERA